MRRLSSTRTTPVPDSRIGKIHVGGYFDPQVRRNLHLLQASTGETAEALIAQALNELFRAHDVPAVDS